MKNIFEKYNIKDDDKKYIFYYKPFYTAINKISTYTDYRLRAMDLFSHNDIDLSFIYKMQNKYNRKINKWYIYYDFNKKHNIYSISNNNLITHPVMHLAKREDFTILDKSFIIGGKDE